jgi:hypothetical protein
MGMVAQATTPSSQSHSSGAGFAGSAINLHQFGGRLRPSCVAEPELTAYVAADVIARRAEPQ